MNMEILFKAKRIDNGEWVEGFIFEIKGKFYIMEMTQTFMTAYYSEESVVDFNMRAVEIDPDTLCQYTGLTDKNGKEIWENDICDRKEKYPEIVTYNEGDWQLDYSYAFGKEMHYAACNLGFYACERKCVEVIGNVFDNQELLEV